jgi:very-short-patch-repair endonuclease
MRGAEPFKRNRARHLRGTLTDAERKLWYALRDRRVAGFKFRRQHPEPPYTLDFFCAEARLVVEVDGGQHSAEVDAKRTAALEAKGLQVLRFWNNEVLENLPGCVDAIVQAVERRIDARRRERGSNHMPGDEG